MKATDKENIVAVYILKESYTDYMICSGKSLSKRWPSQKLAKI